MAYLNNILILEFKMYLEPDLIILLAKLLLLLLFLSSLEDMLIDFRDMAREGETKGREH